MVNLNQMVHHHPKVMILINNKKDPLPLDFSKMANLNKILNNSNNNYHHLHPMVWFQDQEVHIKRIKITANNYTNNRNSRVSW